MVQRLRELREQMGLKQKDLAKVFGLTARRISAYESSEQEPSIEVLQMIANYFGVSVDFLIGNSKDLQQQPNSSPLSLSRFGERIREYRIEKSIKQTALAKQVEITPSYLNLIESGTKIPSFDLALRILNELEMSADAALRDCLIAGAPIQASFLQTEIASLPADRRILALSTINATINALKKQY